MGASVTIDTSGIDRLLAELDPRGKELIQVTAEGIKGDAMTNIQNNDQVDTGNMLNSGYARPAEGSGGWVYDVGFSADYAIHQEFGFHTGGGFNYAKPEMYRYIPGRPFLIPAFEKWRQPFLDAWKEIFP